MSTGSLGFDHHSLQPQDETVVEKNEFQGYHRCKNYAKESLQEGKHPRRKVSNEESLQEGKHPRKEGLRGGKAPDEMRGGKVWKNGT